MPWKIHNAEFDGPAPFLHLADQRVDLNLVTDTKTGGVRVYIGPDHAIRLDVSIDAKGVHVESGMSPTFRDLQIIDNVLETLGIDGRDRGRALQPYWAQARRTDTPRIQGFASFARR